MRKLALIATSLLAAVAAAQQAQKPPEPQATPSVKVNVLNVCAPSAEEQAVLKSALVKANTKAVFAEDFEIARGRATVKDAPASKYVRLRRDLPPESPLLTAQYSISMDEKNTVEILVLRVRDTKDFFEVSIEDRVSAGAASPQTVVATDTPAARIRIERLGKSSIALARCEGADQSAYEPLFREASSIMAQYRKALGLRNSFRQEINWLGSAEPAKSAAPKKSAAPAADKKPQ
ncbi:MAG TPA: hypothetical protein VF532_02460 [Candidatus Angelobacter sp.]